MRNREFLYTHHPPDLRFNSSNHLGGRDEGTTMNCMYMVTSAPAGCEYKVGEIVYLDCDPGCADILISDGACQTAYLTSMSCDCV